jgi:putative ABC transport system permease protein
MTIIPTLQIAFRNCTRNSRRFILLGLAVTAGFLCLCTAQGLVAGLTYQINTRGARYYGGHVIVSRKLDAPGAITPAEEDRLIAAAISRAGVHPTVVSHRTRYDTDGIVFFNGESVMARRIIGMDWSAEGVRIKGLQLVSGHLDDMNDPGGVLISDVTARRLGAQVGDRIVVQVNRQGGAVNTFSLGVKAIFHEVSIFGFYTVYMDRGALDKALGFPLEYSATTGLYLRDYRSAGAIAARLNRTLGTHYTAQPVIDFMEEVRTLLGALTLVSYGILVLLAIVIAVGILNLYKVIIYERTREIGTMRAIGLQRMQVSGIIFFEALFLALCSIGAGLALSVLGLAALSLPRLPGVAGLDIFLDRGHLSWVLYADEIGVDAVLVTIVTLIGALGPARSAQSIQPVDAIRAV